MGTTTAAAWKSARRISHRSRPVKKRCASVESDGADLHVSELMVRLELLVKQIAVGKALPTPTAAESSNTRTGKQVCYRFGQAGQCVGNCSVRDGRRCYCNEEGHIARQCPREKRGITEHKVSVVNVETRRGQVNGPIIACTVVDPLTALGKIGKFHAAYLIDIPARPFHCALVHFPTKMRLNRSPHEIQSVPAAAKGQFPIFGYCEMVMKLANWKRDTSFV